jgi:hypothetical protein
MTIEPAVNVDLVERRLVDASCPLFGMEMLSVVFAVS